MNALYSLILCLFVLSGCDLGPQEKPSIDDLAGIYKLVSAPSFCSLETESDLNLNSKISLNNDLSVSVENIPDCIIHSRSEGKRLSGEGTWEVIIPEADASYGVVFNIEKGNTLNAGRYNSLVLVGEDKPFKLAYIIGDPDSLNRLTYEKVD